MYKLGDNYLRSLIDVQYMWTNKVNQLWWTSSGPILSRILVTEEWKHTKMKKHTFLVTEEWKDTKKLTFLVTEEWKDTKKLTFLNHLLVSDACFVTCCHALNVVWIAFWRQILLILSARTAERVTLHWFISPCENNLIFISNTTWTILVIYNYDSSSCNYMSPTFISLN